MINQSNPVGCPRKYATPEELQSKIDEYFDIGVKSKSVIVGPKNARYEVIIKVPTITGLVLYCGFCDRRSFYDYENYPEFSHTIKNARTKIEQEYEEQLQCGLGAGAIFALKNFGWQDVIEHTGEIKSLDTIINIIRIEKKDDNRLPVDVTTGRSVRIADES